MRRVYRSNRRRELILRKEFSEVAVELGEYTVNFITNGRTVNRKELFDWSREQDEKIRYYSGTAVYRTAFHWKDKPEQLLY